MVFVLGAVLCVKCYCVAVAGSGSVATIQHLKIQEQGLSRDARRQTTWDLGQVRTSRLAQAQVVSHLAFGVCFNRNRNPTERGGSAIGSGGAASA